MRARGLLRILLLLSLVTGIAVLPTSKALAAPSDNAIVKQSQNPGDPTAWLLVGGQRYWIPNGGTYECLRASGVPGPYGLSNAELSARPDQTGQHAACGGGNNPFGHFDEAASRSPGTITVRGWAIDPNVRTRSLVIHVYIGGPAGSGAEGHAFGPVTAYRPDVGAAFPGAGNNHGFDQTLTTGRNGAQEVCAYAINAGPGGNVHLGCKTVTVIPPLPPLGSVETAPLPPLGSVETAIVKQSQNPGDPTAWLLVGGQRYWIPNGGTYECLRASGVPGPYGLSNAELDARPDQVGHLAICGSGNGAPSTVVASTAVPCTGVDGQPIANPELFCQGFSYDQQTYAWTRGDSVAMCVLTLAAGPVGRVSALVTGVGCAADILEPDMSASESVPLCILSLLADFPRTRGAVITSGSDCAVSILGN